MTVKELIEQLSRLNQDVQVFAEVYGAISAHDITGVVDMETEVIIYCDRNLNPARYH